MFDVEQSLFLDKEKETKDNHVFVAGLARSGTTVLLNAIYQSNQFASLSYADMPFILAPNFWAKINPTKKHAKLKERAHGDGIAITTDSPEAFEEVFWKTFDKSSFNREQYFKNYISLILKKNLKTRYLSKNNQNIRRLSDIKKYFPQSKILIPFRDPIQHANSLLFQHKKFIEEQQEESFVLNYMRWIYHSEFGLDYECISPFNLKYEDTMHLNHWLEQWYLTYRNVLELPIKQKPFYFIHYESLCNDSTVWIEVKKLLDLNKELTFPFKESQKNIEETYDHELLFQSNDLYKELQQRSFPIS